MSFLLFPGRHLVNTRFQEQYLARCLAGAVSAIPGLDGDASGTLEPITEIIFAVTSSNQENSRFNPIPFHIRAIGVDRFARALHDHRAVRYRIFGIPHYGHTPNFATFTIKEIAEQSEGAVRLNPENTVVLCSTPEVASLYRQLGFLIARAEQTEKSAVQPIDLVRLVGDAGESWETHGKVASALSPATAGLFRDFPEVPRRIARLYQDPITNQEGSLTGTRNYSTYARGMNEIIRLKYLDIHDALKSGRIVDEGCADGALLAEISRDFPDSDLLGVDLSSEFSQRFKERQRAGEFGGAYVHFFHRNLFDRIFEAATIDTTICNSTLHEIWSYGEQEKSVRSYLAEKLRQLRPGGRLVIRDVVGPEDGEREVFLWCDEDDGSGVAALRENAADISSRTPEVLTHLSTRDRFLLFAKDFLGSRRPFPAKETREYGKNGFLLSLRQAAEFLSKKDYTDNWSSEMNEEFCFWSFSKWKSVLKQLGFRVLENPNNPGSGSRVYTNSWIVEHRYQGRAAIFAPGTGEDMPFPPTNMVLVAEKPVTNER